MSYMPRALYTFIGLIVLLFLGACGQEEYAALPPDETIPFRQDGTLTFLQSGNEVITISIEIADNDSAQARGLMQRTSLPDSSGMLFIFDREEERNFWMANTPLSLDIFFVNADSEIVSIAKYTTPFSSRSIPSGQPAQYVIETEAGFADRYGIVESGQVSWQVSRVPRAPIPPAPLPLRPPGPDTTAEQDR
jgi:uncharacterized protein